MKDWIFFLYLLSYTSGIGALTLFAFYYRKYRNPLVLRLIRLDLFFTLTLGFDTVNYYRRIISPNLSNNLELMLIFGLLVSCAGIIYDLGALAFEATGKAWGKPQQWIYAGLTGIPLGLILLLQFLYQGGLISHHLAVHGSCSISNFYLVLSFFYIAAVVIRSWQLLDTMIRPMVKASMAISGVILPLSVVANGIQFKYALPFPLAFSPIEYFGVNLIFIAAASHYFMGVDHTAVDAIATVTPRPSLAANLEEVVNRHRVSEREAEIIRWIIQGYNNQEIGEQLFISPHTVKNHLYSIYRKLGVKSRFELIKMVMGGPTATTAELSSNEGNQ